MDENNPIFVANLKDVAAEDFDGEVVLVNFNNGRYFNMEGSANVTWQCLERPIRFKELLQKLADHFSQSEDEISQTLKPFLVKMLKEHLVTFAKELPDSGEEVKLEQTGDKYVPPSIEVFDDLEELFWLDPVHEVEPDKGWPFARQEEKADANA